MDTAEQTLTDAMDLLRRARAAVDTARSLGAQHQLQVARTSCMAAESVFAQALKNPEVVDLLAARSDLAAQAEELRKG